MRHTPKKIQLAIITCVLLGITSGLVFWWTKKTAYTADPTKTSFVNNMLESIANNIDKNRSRQGLIEAYCTAMGNAEGFSDPAAKGLYYDPQQSFFVGLLCSKTSVKMKKSSKFVRSYDWEELKIKGCTWDDSMTSCDYSIFLPKLFAIIMNDISKSKLAQLYTYQGSSEEDAIKHFSDTYFGSGETICKKKDTIYLGKEEGGDKEKACYHPETRAIVEQFVQQAKEFTEKTKYIDPSNLLKPNDDKKCSKDGKEFLTCAFDNKNSLAWDAFHNLIYNELLFYKLFITMVNDRIKYPEYNAFQVYTDTQTESSQEVVRLAQEQILSTQSIGFMEKTLQNMQTTFPIHIGLLAYYEDVLAFRKALARVYTPVHQLYYKLRNVQEKY